MSTVGFRINAGFCRAKKELVELFRDVPVANIADCMSRIACLDTSIYAVNHAPLLGTAFTVRAPSGDNLMFHKALDMAQPGDVIVVAGGGTTERAYCGEIMALYAKARGLNGFVVDGSIRDSDELALLEFPIYARGVTPNGPYKNGPGEIGFDVSVGGQVIHPGDILVGDGDGVVVIQPKDAIGIAEAAKKILEKELHIKEDILHNLSRAWVDEVLAQKGVDYC